MTLVQSPTPPLSNWTNLGTFPNCLLQYLHLHMKIGSISEVTVTIKCVDSFKALNTASNTE